MFLYPTIITSAYYFALVYFHIYLSGCTHFQDHSNWSCVLRRWIAYFRNLFDFKGCFLHLNNHDKRTKTGIIKAIDMSVLLYVCYLYCILIYENGCVLLSILIMFVYILLYKKSKVIIGFWLDSCSIVASHCISHITRIW